MADIKRFGEMETFDGKNYYAFFRSLLKDIDREDAYVHDGVYDISDIDFIDPNLRVWKPTEDQIRTKYNEVMEFVNKYPNFVVADAYQTEYPLFLSEMPTKTLKFIGSGFNHGSNNIIDNCPKRILICGEDD